jgi:hypothetical protein
MKAGWSTCFVVISSCQSSTTCVRTRTRGDGRHAPALYGQHLDPRIDERVLHALEPLPLPVQLLQLDLSRLVAPVAPILDLLGRSTKYQSSWAGANGNGGGDPPPAPSGA